jgi:hypothetical protein
VSLPVQHQKRLQRAYTTAVVIVTTGAVAYAIDLHAAAGRAEARRGEAARLAADAQRIHRHAEQTDAQFTALRRTYRTVVASATRDERRLGRELAAARRAARRSGTHTAAPVSYATSVQTSYAAAAPVTGAAASAPTSGTS